MLKKRKTTAAKLSALIACAALLLPGASVSAQDGAAEDTAGGGSETTTTQPASESPLMPVETPWVRQSDDGSTTQTRGMTTPADTPPTVRWYNALEPVDDAKLAGDVTFVRVGPSDAGTVAYELRAKLQFDRDMSTDSQQAGTYRRDMISFSRSEVDLPAQWVEGVSVNGVALPDDKAELFEFSSSAGDVDTGVDLPESLKGDLISLDTSGLELPQSFTVTMRVHLPEDTPDDAVFRWGMYEGDADAFLLNASLRSADRAARLGVEYGDVPPNSARVVVQVAGERLPTGQSNGATKVPDGNGKNTRMGSVHSFSPGEGAELQLFAPLNTANFGNKEANLQFTGSDQRVPVNQPWAKCTADANGECVFNIPTSGPETHEYYWVAMTKASPGYEVQPLIRVGASGEYGRTGFLLQYAYATPKLETGKTYYSGVQYKRGNGNGADWQSGASASSAFMYESYTGSGSTRRQRSSLGAFQQIKKNPEFGDACNGLNVAFVVDASGSMGGDGEETIKSVLNQAVDGLAGTSAKVGMFSFASASPARDNPANLQTPTPLDTEAGRQAAKTWIKSYTHVKRDFGGDTNWYAALQNVGKYNDKNPDNRYDVIFLITDGNPTRAHNDFGNPDAGQDESSEPISNDNGINTEFRDVEAAMAAANTVKSQGTRIIAVGIPSAWGGSPPPKGETQLDISDENLQAITGRLNGGANTTDLRAADFAHFNDSEVMKQAILASLDCAPPEVETEFDFQLSKVDASDQSQSLGGAEFTLSALDDDNQELEMPAATGDPSAGQFTWSNLKFGRYKLTETKAAADGYSLLPRPVYFRVAQTDGETKLYLLNDAADVTGTEVSESESGAIFPVVQFSAASDSSSPQVSMKLANIRAGELPASGGPGLHLWLLLGTLIVIAGVTSATHTTRRGPQ